jgi:hypothetical protein
VPLRNSVTVEKISVRINPGEKPSIGVTITGVNAPDNRTYRITVGAQHWEVMARRAEPQFELSFSHEQAVEIHARLGHALGVHP